MSESDRLGGCVRRWLNHLRETGSRSARSYASLLAGVEAWGRFRPVAGLKVHQITAFIDGQTTWSPGTKCSAWNRLRSCLRWNREQGYTSCDPLAGVRRPARYRPSSRGSDFVLPPALSSLLVAESSGPLKDFLRALRGTGARPGELAWAVAANFDAGRRAIVHRHDAAPPLYVHKTAGRKRHGAVDRVIRLDPATEAVVRRNARAGGLLLPAEGGEPWTFGRLSCRWLRLLKRPKVSAWLRRRNHSPRRVVPYSFRHTWITKAIGRGVSVKLVADLAGTSVAMIERHYCHAHDDDEAMRRAFRMASV